MSAKSEARRVVIEATHYDSIRNLIVAAAARVDPATATWQEYEASNASRDAAAHQLVGYLSSYFDVDLGETMEVK